MYMYVCVFCLGFELVKPYIFQPSDPKSMGSDIFSRLVPMRAYEAASIYRYMYYDNYNVLLLYLLIIVKSKPR